MSRSALNRPVNAANDNGVFSPGRSPARADIVRLGAQVAGPISVRYLTERVYIIERQGTQEQRASCLEALRACGYRPDSIARSRRKRMPPSLLESEMTKRTRPCPEVSA